MNIDEINNSQRDFNAAKIILLVLGEIKQIIIHNTKDSDLNIELSDKGTLEINYQTVDVNLIRYRLPTLIIEKVI
jgi:hypothetical protein